MLRDGRRTESLLPNTCPAMNAYRLETRIAQKGTLHLDALPFDEGECVEVIVLAREPSPQDAKGAPLRGAVKRYDAPADPVAPAEWEAAQ